MRTLLQRMLMWVCGEGSTLTTYARGGVVSPGHVVAQCACVAAHEWSAWCTYEARP